MDVNNSLINLNQGSATATVTSSNTTAKAESTAEVKPSSSSDTVTLNSTESAVSSGKKTGVSAYGSTVEAQNVFDAGVRLPPRK
ncbi:hypothetical protein [Ferrimonas aestuarii]|uniref:Uncharacterized protein n=1 Tax=Ferrimonas aestuarii TaxID=2569539 RepID=A0A4U1BSQ5_9GAMM|nr:hypothetical protein [Ferrimonas aestuarii]TKB58693.1 hypothetical protein FCL42_02800 [Ferrimonas aestuarii]